MKSFLELPVGARFVWELTGEEFTKCDADLLDHDEAGFERTYNARTSDGRPVMIGDTESVELLERLPD